MSPGPQRCRCHTLAAQQLLPVYPRDPPCSADPSPPPGTPVSSLLLPVHQGVFRKEGIVEGGAATLQTDLVDYQIPREGQARATAPTRGRTPHGAAAWPLGKNMNRSEFTLHTNSARDADSVSVKPLQKRSMRASVVRLWVKLLPEPPIQVLAATFRIQLLAVAE